MKALTVKQPWAWAIFNGKPIENRTWRLHHRGPLAVHAGLSTDPFAIRWMQANVPDLAPRPLSYDRGYILGVVELVDCHWSRPGCCDTPWAETAPGVAHLVLEQPRLLLYPIAARGRQGPWDLRPDDERAVLEQLGAVA